MKKTTKTQIITIISLILYAVWEFHVTNWAKTEAGPIIRIDLIIIYPILIVLIVLSIRQLLTRKNCSERQVED